ncbi:MAG: DUF4157 domain-containing protein, partial [Okeania sp. SIO2D1]|nr:DUF4157 domain-containing protein [Okeania sp. SIO2D1]
MIANVMINFSESNYSPPPNYINGKQLQVPRPQEREGHIAPVHQLKAPPRSSSLTAQVPTPNKTGLPDRLKAGVENLSGYSLDNVKVHYNSPKPAQLQALAYTQGTDIHVAPGQEKHLPHETWHVVQQMQGRVKPTMQMKGVQINDNAGLEREADVMGELATTNIKKLEKRLDYTQHKTQKRENAQIQRKNGKGDPYKKNQKRVKDANPNVVENSTARVQQFGGNWEVRSWRDHLKELGLTPAGGSGSGKSTESGKQIFKV